MSNVIAMVLAVLLSVESSDGTDMRDGDNGKSVGPYKIKKIAVREANRIVGHRRWTYADRYDLAKSREMCKTTMEFHYSRGIRDPVDLACKWQMPYGRATPEYRKRVSAAMRAKYGI